MSRTEIDAAGIDPRIERRSRICRQTGTVCEDPQGDQRHLGIEVETSNHQDGARVRFRGGKDVNGAQAGGEETGHKDGGG